MLKAHRKRGYAGMGEIRHVFILENLLPCPMGGGGTHTYCLTAHKTLAGAQARATQEGGAVIEWAEDAPGQGLPSWRGDVAGKLRWRISEEMLRD